MAPPHSFQLLKPSVGFCKCKTPSDTAHYFILNLEGWPYSCLPDPLWNFVSGEKFHSVLQGQLVVLASDSITTPCKQEPPYAAMDPFLVSSSPKKEASNITESGFLLPSLVSTWPALVPLPTAFIAGPFYFALILQFLSAWTIEEMVWSFEEDPLLPAAISWHKRCCLSIGTLLCL